MLTGETKRRSIILPLLLGGGLWLAFCWSLLCGLSVPGFRDSTYLYYPLFEWLDLEWSKGQVPLWNPYCNLGMSNVGDNTTSLFYPVKLIFFLRFLDYPTRYGIYIALHVLLAGVGAFVFSRVLRASVPGATLAAISYAGSGAVLTQATNVVYLVSAAWLPFAMFSVWQMIWSKDRDGIWWGIIGGIFCALMILGGDPQMVYNVGLIAATTIVCKLTGRIRWHRRTSAKTLFQSPSSIRYVSQPILSLLTMVVVTTSLASIQIVPTYQWSRLSERSSVDRPNLFELMYQSFTPDPIRSEPKFDSSLADRAAHQASWKSVIEPLRPDSVSFANYEFSLPPWTLLELFLPNGSGRSFPTHQRWTEILASPQGMPDRVWFLSIYLGSVTAWLGLSGLRFRGAGRRVWLSRIAAFFVLGSFGWYGLSWLLPVPQCGSQVGGVYWWMNLLLPQYRSFRYPAKLFVIVSLTICVLAGLQFNARTFRSLNPITSRMVWIWIGLLSIGTLSIQTNGFEALTGRLSDNALFGPFDLAGSIQGLKISLLQSLSMFGILLIALLWMMTGVALNERRANLPLWILVAISAFDLVFANYWILALVPRESFTAKVSTPKLIASSAAPFTIYRKRDAYIPAHWSSRSSPNRLDEIIRWQRETLYPKQHLGRHVRLMGSFGSIQPKQNEDLLKMFDDLPTSTEPRQVHPPVNRSTSQEVVSKNPLLMKEERCDGELVSVSSEQLNEPQVTFWRDQPRLVFLRAAQTEHQAQANGQFVGDCELTEFSSNSIVLNVHCQKNCELIHSSLFDGNWEASIKSVPTGHTTSLKLTEFQPGLQGLSLRPGEYEIRLEYVPRAFWISAWISLVAWTIAILYSAARYARYARVARPWRKAPGL
jgi:hypothetical protein